MIVKGKAPLVYKICAFWMPLYFKPIYRYKIKGMENIPKDGKVILVSNHTSANDPLILILASKRPLHFMAKAELFKSKFGGWFLRSAGQFPVARGTGGGDALQEAYDLVNSNEIVGVFLEGTRSPDGEPLRPKTGVSLVAYNTKATVVPVCITSEGGKPLKAFKRKTFINIGKPIEFENLGMTEGTSMHYRRGAKYIMSKIKDLRAEAIELMK